MHFQIIIELNGKLSQTKSREEKFQNSRTNLIQFGLKKAADCVALGILTVSLCNVDCAADSRRERQKKFRTNADELQKSCRRAAGSAEELEAFDASSGLCFKFSSSNLHKN